MENYVYYVSEWGKLLKEFNTLQKARDYIKENCLMYGRITTIKVYDEDKIRIDKYTQKNSDFNLVINKIITEFYDD